MSVLTNRVCPANVTGPGGPAGMVYSHAVNAERDFANENPGNTILFVDAFDEISDKITQFISNVCLGYLILYPCCKFRSNTPDDCQDFESLLLQYFNVGNLAHS